MNAISARAGTFRAGHPPPPSVLAAARPSLRHDWPPPKSFAMSFNVPSEPIWAIFTPDVIRQLSLVGNPSRDLEFRLQVLAAGGLNSHTPRGQALRACKAAWEVYLFAAFACGLFENPHGPDLRSRLTGVDDDNFRSAMSECLAAWYLAGKRKLHVEARPEGRPGHPLEFVLKLSDGDINVEVKAPFRPITSDFWWGDDAAKRFARRQQAIRGRTAQSACRRPSASL